MPSPVRARPERAGILAQTPGKPKTRGAPCPRARAALRSARRLRSAALPRDSMTTRPVIFLGVGHPHAAGRANRLRNVPELALLGAFDDDRQLAHPFALRYGTRAFGDPEDALREARGGLCIVETRNRRGA